MRTKIITVFIIAITALSTLANSVKSPASAVMMNIAYSLQIYKENNHGNIPRSWKELFESGYISEDGIKRARLYCDVENRYQFVDLELINKDRIIVLAKQPGGEGNSPDSQNPDDFEGRYTIVLTPSGEIRFRSSTEKSLKEFFAKSGLNLADYTWNAPPPPNIPTPIQSGPRGLILGGPVDTNDPEKDAPQRPHTSIEKKERSSHPVSSQSVGSVSYRSIFAICAVLGILVAIWLKARKDIR